MSDRIQSASGTIITVLVSLGLVAVAVVVLLPMLTPRRHGYSRPMASNTQLRGIHQAMVIYAQSNKTGGRDGYFPGLDATGNVLPDGPDTGHSGDGLQPSARMWILLEANVFTPEYAINPADAYAAEASHNGSSYATVTHGNFSYAMLGFAPGSQAAEEWKETLNASAVVMSDRAIGSGRADISSVWTEPGSGDWTGGIVKNDNSVVFETSQDVDNTQYGPPSPPGTFPTPATPNPIDDIFYDDPAADDAYLVHEDATTAYSAR